MSRCSLIILVFLISVGFLSDATFSSSPASFRALSLRHALNLSEGKLACDTAMAELGRYRLLRREDWMPRGRSWTVTYTEQLLKNFREKAIRGDRFDPAMLRISFPGELKSKIEGILESIFSAPTSTRSRLYLRPFNGPSALQFLTRQIAFGASYNYQAVGSIELFWYLDTAEDIHLAGLFFHRLRAEGVTESDHPLFSSIQVSEARYSSFEAPLVGWYPQNQEEAQLALEVLRLSPRPIFMPSWESGPRFILLSENESREELERVRDQFLLRLNNLSRNPLARGLGRQDISFANLTKMAAWSAGSGALLLEMAEAERENSAYETLNLIWGEAVSPEEDRALLHEIEDFYEVPLHLFDIRNPRDQGSVVLRKRANVSLAEARRAVLEILSSYPGVRILDSSRLGTGE